MRYALPALVLILALLKAWARRFRLSQQITRADARTRLASLILLNEGKSIYGNGLYPRVAVAARLSKEAPFTRVVHNAGCCRVETDGVMSMMATEAIAKGTVLLVEHVVNGDELYIHDCVMTDPTLFDALYPRSDITWSKERLLACDLEPLVAEKVISNSFGCQDSSVSVGCAISAFNHGAKPHASVHEFILRLGEGVSARFMYMIVEVDIAPGEEIFIAYRQQGSSVHPYVEERADLMNFGVTEEEMLAARDDAQSIVLDYEKTDVFERMVGIHEKVRDLMSDAR